MIINQGNTHRFHDLAKLTLTDAGGKAGVSIFRSTPLPIPLTLKSMERHPLSSQAFYPLSGFPFIVAVAPPGEMDATAIEIFLASPDQGVNYHPGTWHHYCLALEKESKFLVIDRVADDENCEEVELPLQAWLHIDLSGISRA
jgi:ureidoglycolate lyase